MCLTTLNKTAMARHCGEANNDMVQTIQKRFRGNLKNTQMKILSNNVRHDDISKVSDAQFWPEHIGYRRHYKKRRNNKDNGETTQ